MRRLPNLPSSDTIALDPVSPLAEERAQAKMIEHDRPYGVGAGHMGEPIQDDSDDVNEALGRSDDTTWLMPDHIRLPQSPPYMEDATPPQVDDDSHYFDQFPVPGRSAQAENIIVQTAIPLQDAPPGWLSNVRGEYIPISTVAKLRLANGNVIACTQDGEETLAIYPDNPADARDAMNVVATIISAAMGITGNGPETNAEESAQE